MSSDKLLVKCHSNHATLPRRATEGSAGYDLYSSEACSIGPGERRIVSTDISIEVPQGTYGRIAPRSGLAVKWGINVLAGVIDLVSLSILFDSLFELLIHSFYLQDYRGVIGVVLVNHSNLPFKIDMGDRIAQLILEVCATPEVEEAKELSQTIRGEDGFGSTGGASLAPVVNEIVELDYDSEKEKEYCRVGDNGVTETLPDYPPASASAP